MIVASFAVLQGTELRRCSLTTSFLTSLKIEDIWRLIPVTIATKSSLQHKYRHVKNVHEDSDGQFICDQCDNSFISNTALLYHTQKHHEAKQTFSCEYCEQTFSLKHSLDVHVRSVHKYDTVKCNICKKTFNRQSNLSCHYRYVHDILENVLVMDDGLEIEYYECEDCPFESRYEKY